MYLIKPGVVAFNLDLHARKGAQLVQGPTDDVTGAPCLNLIIEVLLYPHSERIVPACWE